MKKYFVGVLFAAMGLQGSAQEAEKPELIVMPSVTFCKDRGYVTEVEGVGSKNVLPDFKAAAEDNDFDNAAMTINEAFNQRNFPLKSLKEGLSALDENNAFDNQGTDRVEMDADAMLMAVVKPDIKLELSAKVTDKIGPRLKSWNITLKALDSYTTRQVGQTINYNTPEPTSEPLASLITAAVNSQIDGFCDGMMNHFRTLKEKGREVQVRFLVQQGAGIDLVREKIGTQSPYNYILARLKELAFNQVAKVNGGTAAGRVSYLMRIPFFDENGEANSVTTVMDKIAELPDFPFEFFVKQRGIGQADIILTGKKY